jgi:hypothetical protein
MPWRAGAAFNPRNFHTRHTFFTGISSGTHTFSMRKDIMMFEGLVGLVVLIIDIWAIINVLGSSASNVEKLIWILVIIFLPVIGAIAWLVVGPRSAAV